MVKKDIIEEAFVKAKEVINVCSTPYGLFASGGNKGYTAVWSRDSMISMIGASLVHDESFKETFKLSLITLAENQGKSGQIPNCVDKFADRDPHVDFKTIDSSLWYIIGHYVFKTRYKDDKLFKDSYKTIEKALNWLYCQDPGEVGMLAQLPTSDWQDAFPHKYGYTINTQALYYKVLNLMGKIEDANKLRFMVNDDLDDNLWNGKFYLPYRWKNHGKYKEIGDWFDSLGNMLAIVFDLADKERAEKILAYIKSKKIAEPYPIRVISPPIKKGDKFWQDYFLDCAAGKPNDYANGGIWGYIGCFYVLALIKVGKFDEARKALEKIAEANLNGNFPEWTHPINKKSHGSEQAWEAGMYILAYKSLKEKKVLI
ncbi:MAG: amylo-alpha-1,6-glucosidase [Candidatus Pacearchaeota archaeon]|jgi:glycogen debranching enzyme